MAAIECLTDTRADANDSSTSAVRHSIAGFLSSIQEPAAQTAALQLMRGKIAFDKSTAICMGLVGLTILEELV